jgi:2-dehydropantoate 2-reductase
VTVVARAGSARLLQLQRDQGIRHQTGGLATVRIADALDEATAFDLIVVTTLAHQVDAVLPALQRSKAKCIQFMFNTFDPERLRDAVGGQRCSFGMPFVMATIDPEGTLHSTINPGQKTLHGDRRWADLFSAAGMPSAYEAQMLLWLRCHAPLCVSFESISVAAQRRRGGASWAESMLIARGMQGGFAVIRGLGFRLYPTAKSALNAAPVFVVACLLWAASRVSTFTELLATGVNECRALIDTMAAADVTPPLPAAIAALRAMKPTEAPLRPQLLER